MDYNIDVFLDLLACGTMVLGTTFMLLAAVGLWRLPDLYHRMHAATKGVTLGITGLLIAALCNLSTLPDARPVNIATKAILLILFQFVANPVGAHLLAKAAHADRCPIWKDTLSDELEEDTLR
jgi:multicomponent Na+:H+ antiporter subunit G